LRGGQVFQPGGGKEVLKWGKEVELESKIAREDRSRKSNDESKLKGEIR